MSNAIKMLAIDLGASNGRAILGILEDEKLTIQEVHRFSNDPVMVNGNLYWDILRLFHEIKQGILNCVRLGHRDIQSIAVDTWGVDFGLLDSKDNLLGNPYHYRDKRTGGMMEKLQKLISKEELYNITGIEFMWFNTILQLYSMKRENSSLLKEAKTLLLTPDLLNYFLSGVKTTEYSIASTTQLLDAYTKCWSDKVIDQLDLPREIFTDIIPSGTIIGELTEELSTELGIQNLRVIAVAGHDTQSAIAAVPTEDEDFAYISCGTWSLMGFESNQPIINEKSMDLSVTNEGGVGGKITVLKNIMGLWLIQECKRYWDNEGQGCTFAELDEKVIHAKPFISFVDPDDVSFIAPGNMPERIREYCRKTGQPVPETKGEVVRCITQSLALKYRMTVEKLEDLLGKKLPVIHMVGGGIKDKLLCRFTAEATGRSVIAGPIEASSIGNILVQAMALGKIKDLKQIRNIVKASFPIVTYTPTEKELWDKAYVAYKEIIKK
ncbi:MAG: rhamnulokinase [Clostridiaceae bacterium]|nr:rhamnulokinase [Clostridiaceae bacterium]